MSPQLRKRVRAAGLWATATLAVAAWAGPRAVDAAITTVDERYVKADSFRVFRQRLELKSQRDSMSYTADLREIRSLLSRVDSGVNDVRRCQRKPRSCE